MSNSSRREFLKLSLMAGAISLVPSVPVVSAFSPLPHRRGARQRVLILGAGLAGMNAAMELIAMGHELTILEGQMRAGGRVQTLRTGMAPGLYADLGAARIPDNHFWTMKFIKKYGLQTELFNPPKGKYIQLIRGKRMVYDAGQSVPLESYPISLQKKEYQMGLNRIMQDAMAPIQSKLGDPTDLNWPPKGIEQYDKFTLREFLVQQGYSPELTEILFAGWESKASGLDMSVLESMRELALSFGNTRLKVVGGNDLIPRGMSEELGDIIRYGHKVLSVSQNDDRVEVTCEHAGERETLTADRVVCTFPPPVLKKMGVIESFTTEKQHAIRNYGFWDLSRTILQVRERYWKKEGLNGFASTDQPAEIWDPLYETEGNRGLIADYVKKQDTDHYSSLDEQGRIDFSANRVNDAFPGIRKVLEGGFCKSWKDDPWAQGAHSMGEVNQMTSMLQALLKPEGRIYLAGEHASAYHGWMQGALESGARVAREINEVG